MSSKADDFDARYRDAGSAARRPSGYRGDVGGVGYDLGYDSPGWDTQGFRLPETGERTARPGGPQPPTSMRGQSRTRSTPKRTSQGNQVWPYVLLGASICILLFSGYVVYRSTHTIGPVVSSSSVNQSGDGLIIALAEIGTFLGGLGTFVGTIVKIWEVQKTK